MHYDRFHSNPTQVYWCGKALPDPRTIFHKTEICEIKDLAPEVTQ
jgi:hypothetical protein